MAAQAPWIPWCARPPLGCGGDARLGSCGGATSSSCPSSRRSSASPGRARRVPPVMTLVQTLADPIDPASYGRFYAEPLPGTPPAERPPFRGRHRTYTPAETGEALAVALRATPLAPTLRTVDGLTILGLARERRAPRQRRPGAGHDRVRAARSTRCENGHFVLYNETEAAELTRQSSGASSRARPRPR